ncbi:MAG: hypothetical protein ABSG32_15820 [Terriglobia bacterium]|jgi:hypothetical protein
MEAVCHNLLKTNGDKMSNFRFSMMLMKTKELSQSLHDVDENKGDDYLTQGNPNSEA